MLLIMLRMLLPMLMLKQLKIMVLIQLVQLCQVTHKQAARDAINQATATKRQQINSNREATQEEKMQH